MDDLISIVIPTKNRTDRLKFVLPSYLKQGSVKEIIIIDDSDGNDTESFIKSILDLKSKIKYTRNTTNRGVPGSRNIGIKQSTGKYLFFGEDDVELEQDHLITLLSHLKKSKAHISAGRIITIISGESKEDAVKRADKSKILTFKEKLLLVDYSAKLENDIVLPFSHAIMLIDKIVFSKVMYDENFKGNFWREETDFQLGAKKNGFKLIFCPHTVCYHLATNTYGGCHSSNKLAYEYWVLKNNIYFINKHRLYCKEQFNINYLSYLIRLIIYRIIINFKGLIIKIKYANSLMPKSKIK